MQHLCIDLTFLPCSFTVCRPLAPPALKRLFRRNTCRDDKQSVRRIKSPAMSQNTFKILSELLIDVFEVDDLVPTHATAAADVPGWDSLGNIRLFLSIEQEFGIRFTAGEIGGIKNLGELADAIDARA